MIRLCNELFLYHGSYLEVPQIDLAKCSGGLDFGQGFYLTSSLRQAMDFIPASVKKNIRRNRIPKDFRLEDGCVSVYRFHAQPELFIHYFDDADAEWLHFVASNRDTTLFSELLRKYSTVDIIGGKVADDATALVLNEYIAGTYGKPGSLRADRFTIEELETNRLKDQYCFRSRQAVDSLEFVRSVRYGEE